MMREPIFRKGSHVLIITRSLSCDFRAVIGVFHALDDNAILLSAALRVKASAEAAILVASSPENQAKIIREAVPVSGPILMPMHCIESISPWMTAEEWIKSQAIMAVARADIAEIKKKKKT